MLINIPDEMITRVVEELDSLSVTKYPMLTRLWPLIEEARTSPENLVPRIEFYASGDRLIRVVRKGSQIIGIFGKKMRLDPIEMNCLRIDDGQNMMFFEITEIHTHGDSYLYKLKDISE